NGDLADSGAVKDSRKGDRFLRRVREVSLQSDRGRSKVVRRGATPKFRPSARRQRCERSRVRRSDGWLLRSVGRTRQAVRADRRRGRGRRRRRPDQHRAHRVGGVRSYDSAVGLIVSILVVGYLVYALVAPEKL